jgi:hypothetical protein
LLTVPASTVNTLTVPIHTLHYTHSIPLSLAPPSPAPPLPPPLPPTGT